ncbi:unannotated protein [freshwater metagenome]|uniref:Unannotated protein n=1 Tax=freshwater metagenome TaxID=449393 RepID=A0A6J5ZCR1_9ZZZZ
MNLSPRFPQDTTLILVAFAGWSDAGDAATDAVDCILDALDAQEVLVLDSDEFYDYSNNRPEIVLTINDVREIEWPETTVYKATSPLLAGTNIYVVLGVEPNMKWKPFCEQIFSAIPTTPSTVMITLGAMLAEVAYSRPIPVQGSTSHTQLRELTGLEPSRYEGPTGILGILSTLAMERNIASVSYWAAVPHYASAPPCPKATLALVRSVEDLLDCTFNLTDLEEEARSWELGAREMVSEDEDLAEYIRQIEQSQDTAELPEATGEAIAKEFERYLRRRER